MENKEELIALVTQAVMARLREEESLKGEEALGKEKAPGSLGASPDGFGAEKKEAAPERTEADAYFVESHFGRDTQEEDEKAESPSPLAGKTRMREKHSYKGAKRAEKGTDPKEIVIGVGAAFEREICFTICGLPLEEVIRNVRAGIEEEGLTSRVVKVLDTSDVGFMGLQCAKLSGSGIGIGIQSKGTAVIHQKDLYPLTNLELFPQAPLMTLETYRAIGRNAARYVKGETVTPIESVNDPMVRAKFQVKAALMHIIETEQLDPEMGMIEWEG